VLYVARAQSGFVVGTRVVLDEVLERLDVSGRVQHGVEALVYLLLSTGAHLAVEALDVKADFLQRADHGVAYLDGLVIRRGREVADLFTVFVTEVRGRFQVVVLVAIPPTLYGIDVVASLV